MRIKHFTGMSIKDVTDRMKSELGPDAVILSSRKLEQEHTLNGIGSDLYEITAAIDAVPETTAVPARAMHGVRSDLRSVSTGVSEPFPSPAAVMPDLREDLQQFRSEVDALRSSLKEVAGQMRPARLHPVEPANNEILNLLLENDVEPRIAEELVAAVGPPPSKRSPRSGKGWKDQLITTIAKRIRTASAPRQGRKSQRVIALVGPTGVGKTTTIAKLASLQKLVHHAEVGLISADTYRIGAVEQLHTFADITDIPFEVAAKPSDVHRILNRLSHCDVVFIDTVGRSQKMEKEIDDLREMIDTADPDEVHLVVSTTSGRKTMVDIVHRFAALKPNRLLFSKLDEAAALGGILSVVDQHRLQVSYMTTGQNVPYDILEADATQLASMVLGGGLASAS